MSDRKSALYALIDITDHGAYANLRMKQFDSRDDVREAKWIAALVYTTLDHLLTIDYYLAHYAQHAVKPIIRGILRLGVCELLYFDTPSHAIVSEYVTLTKRIGKAPLSGFVNAILRTVDRAREHLPSFPQNSADRISVQYSYPAWLVSEWITQYGETFAEQMCSSPAAPLEIRAQYPYSTEALQQSIPVASERGKLDENCLILQQGIDVAALSAFQNGQMTVQGQSAMLVCRALGDCRTKNILDVCAAPGGKSAYIASLCKNDVQLTCFELHEHRKELLDITLARLHVSAQTICRDACILDLAYENLFDVVFIDAPCSGLGLLHDKPDIRYAKTDSDIVSLSKIQQTLLDVNAHYVVPGGLLVYATCTISMRENEENVHMFLSEHSDFTLEKMPILLKNDGMFQLFPHIHGTDGFFIARMRRG
ncbi:MAG: 16S rRNA (cytosine(967)-C(5))-methyltransferase RsmB [Clostridia bacterium]